MSQPRADGPLAAEALLAELSVAQYRARAWRQVRGACLASVLLWMRALVHVPALLAWLALLAQGSAMVMAATYVMLAARSSRRAAALRPASEPPDVVERAVEWDDLRSALWAGLAAVAVVPWTYEVLGRPWPPALFGELAAFAASLFLLVVVLETAADLIGCLVRRRDRAGPATLRSPPEA